MAANLSYESILDLDARLNLLVGQQDQLGQDIFAAEAAVHDANAQYQELAPALNELQLAKRNLRSAETRLRNAQARVAGANALLATFGPDAEAMRSERLQDCRQRVDAVEADNRNVTVQIERLEYLRRTHVDVLSRTNTHRVLSSRDLLLRIFQFADQHPWEEIAKWNDTHPAETATRTDFPAQIFTCVSHSWRDTVERCPALWTELRITLGPTTSPHAIEKLRGILAISSTGRTRNGQGNAPWPLRIRFDRVSTRLDAHAPIFQLMEAEVHRVTDLVIDALDIPLEDDFMRLLDRPAASLACLRLVVRGRARRPPRTPLAQAPILKRIEVKGSHEFLPRFVYRLLVDAPFAVRHMELDGLRDDPSNSLAHIFRVHGPSLRTVSLLNGSIMSGTLTGLLQGPDTLRTVTLDNVEPVSPHLFHGNRIREYEERRTDRLPYFSLRVLRSPALQEILTPRQAPPAAVHAERPAPWGINITRITLPPGYGLEPAPLPDDRHIPAAMVRTAWNRNAVPG